MSNPMIIRKHSVFLASFTDNSMYFAARMNWPENAKKSLQWTKKQSEEHSEIHPLVKVSLKFEGVAKHKQLVSDLTKKEANLLKSNLIRYHQANGKNVLNLKVETEVALEDRKKPSIMRYCKCGYNRSVFLIELFNKLK
mgnify:CR=1 FL=1